MSKEKKGDMDRDINEGIKLFCERRMGLIDSDFLCQSLSILNPPIPICVDEGAALSEVVKVLQKNKIGCVLVTNKTGEIAGIFSERDCLLKIIGKDDLLTRPVKEVMTPNPMTGTADTTIAYALTLMSEGGFRHIPLVDERNHPVGILSIKNVVDYLVRTFIDDILEFDTEEFL